MANKKITELTELTSPAGTDLFAIVDDTDTTTKKVTVTNLMTQAPVQAAHISGLATQVSLGNHEALTSSVHGISAFGATLVDDADASAARTTLGLGTAATSASTDFSPSFFSTVSETTTSRTLSNSDNGKIIVFTNSSSIDVTIPDTLTSGFSCTLVQSGAGQVTVAASGSASVFGYGGNLSTVGQYAALNIIPTGSNAYLVEGDLGAGPFSNTYSLSLDGTDEYATIGTTYGTLSGNKSICGWFYFDNTSTQTIYAKVGASTYSASHRGWFLLNAGTMNFRAGGTTTSITLTSNITSSTWTHLAVTGDGTDLKLYVNGTQSGSTQTDGDWDIGEFFRTGPYYYFNGYVDEIGLWTGTTLSSSDVSAIANAGATAGDKAVDLSTYTGLTHWWRFGDGDTSPTVSDKVGSNNMTLINGPTFVTQVP